jgi:hypothetical protein
MQFPAQTLTKQPAFFHDNLRESLLFLPVKIKKERREGRRKGKRKKEGGKEEGREGGRREERKEGGKS